MNSQAYILHTRPYRETSLLVEAFTAEQGRITLVARGAKRGKNKTSAILQPFIPLSISWVGNSELVTLTQVELMGTIHDLQAKRAICGLYLNELLIKLLHKWDPCLNLFNAYQHTLQSLAQAEVSSKIALRMFEKQLLKSMGYALQLTREIETGLPVEDNYYYHFDPINGPKLVTNTHISAIKGATLLALERDDFSCARILIDIRRLMRAVLNYHLDTKRIIASQLLNF